MSEEERRQGARKALLEMFESYVLDIIGHLPEETRRSFFIDDPRLAQLGGDWKNVIRFFFPDSDEIEKQIRGMWESHQEAVRGEGIELTPQEFAHLVVEENYTPLVDQAVMPTDGQSDGDTKVTEAEGG